MTVPEPASVEAGMREVRTRGSIGAGRSQEKGESPETTGRWATFARPYG